MDKAQAPAIYTCVIKGVRYFRLITDYGAEAYAKDTSFNDETPDAIDQVSDVKLYFRDPTMDTDEDAETTGWAFFWDADSLSDLAAFIVIVGVWLENPVAAEEAFGMHGGEQWELIGPNGPGSTQLPLAA